MSDPLEQIRLATVGIGEHHEALAANIGAAWHERAATIARAERAEARLDAAERERDVAVQRASALWNALGEEGQQALIDSGWHP